MAQKIIRDPIYDYISFDLPEEQWLLDLLDTSEVQRLRHIHQLGVSYLVYPGATHTRFSHALGVFHLMKQAKDHIAKQLDVGLEKEQEDALLAAAILHDVGHGPFSHVLEGQLTGLKHEDWTLKVIEDGGTEVHEVLKEHGIVEDTALLFRKEARPSPAWLKSLISSQLDLDRMDYLQRDSYFTGVGYGKFDYYRLLHTMELEKTAPEEGQVTATIHLAWPEKSMYPIEQYIFARFYMYQSVYFHHCTRGYEKMLDAILRRAQEIADSLTDVPPALQAFLGDREPSLEEYLNLGECHILAQIKAWQECADPILAELCRGFMCRDGFKKLPWKEEGLSKSHVKAYQDMLERISSEMKVSKVEAEQYYLVEDSGGVALYKPYGWGSEEGDSIFLTGMGEISQVLSRLTPVVKEGNKFRRFYAPKAVTMESPGRIET